MCKLHTERSSVWMGFEPVTFLLLSNSTIHRAMISPGLTWMYPIKVCVIFVTFTQIGSYLSVSMAGVFISLDMIKFRFAPTEVH